jgi:hypothetical protein
MSSEGIMADKNLKRVRRQFDALGKLAPPTRRIFGPLMQRGMLWIRLPIGLLLLLGGVFSFLPVLGLWMLPLGAMLLALDIPLLRPGVVRMSIWSRLWARRRRHRRRAEP